MSFDFEISPDPEPDEAAALIAAVEQALADDAAFDAPTPSRSAWWRAGLAGADE